MCCCVQTGTLTEGDLDLAGVCEVRDGQFQESVADPQVGKQMYTLSVAVLSYAVLPICIKRIFSFL